MVFSIVMNSSWFQLWAAVMTQSFMLFQTGITYMILRWKHRNGALPEGLVPLDTDPLVFNPLVSVIIPAFNESSSISSTLQRVASAASDPVNVEVIVVDAGGSDNTMELAAAAAAELAPVVSIRTNVSACGGRGPTLTAGVAASRGSVLLFLHADTLLPQGFDVAVRNALCEERVLATAFQFKVARDEAFPIVGLGTMEATVHVRSFLWQLPFGDQALALTRQRFLALGGFPADSPIMEDFELVQKLRRAGAAGAGIIRTLPLAAECNGRRWAARGVWRTNLVNQVIMVAYVYGGCSPARIYDLYYHFSLHQWLEGALKDRTARGGLMGSCAGAAESLFTFLIGSIITKKQ